MKVLVAVDFGEFSQAQAKFLKHFSDEKNAQYKLVHVVEPIEWTIQPFFPEDIPQIDALREGRRTKTEELFADFKKLLGTAVGNSQITTEMLEGSPAEKILDAAEEWQADLIVVGSHGRSGIARFVMGSVSQSVAAHAKCSVTIARLA
jgi:nucleotide-binding universal stress UspA family protein